ncbi:MAG: N-acetylmuramoyl-L-alanine amidase [Thermodesulfobacteriota bacterium]|nr:MAG: N-acetylmuramoyl-L-alanine amidase [Thermodesulfobacteriota bacterium]
MNLPTLARLPRKTKKALLLIVVFILPFLLLQSKAVYPRTNTSYITAIRYWSNPDYTRVVINLSGKTRYNYRLLRKDPSINKPRRLYIDFSRSAISGKLKRSIPIYDGLLKKARVGQHNKQTVRVVLDIESIKDYRIFPLNDPFRLVIDITGKRKNNARALKKEPAPRSKKAARPLKRYASKKKFTIVIDAGHGGKDPGALGRKGTREKDITLKIARLVSKKLSRKLSSRIIMTRTRDIFIPLEERTAIANSKGADLFVSIHVNSSPRRSASGVETYILSLTNDQEARRVAARENATTKKGLSDLEFILADLIKTAKTNDSIRLATSVQDRLVNRLKRRYRGINGYGVKGAPFYVLVGTRMPSILVEVSFISNARDEKRLRSSSYLNELAEGITRGIIEHINGAGRA